MTHRLVTLAVTLALGLGFGLLLAPDAARAQGCGGVEERECPARERADPSFPGTSLNSGATKQIIKILQGARDTCGTGLELRYRIDCLRVYYLKVAELLPERGDYLPIRKAMLDAAAKLDAIVLANLDERTPPIRPREGNKPLAKRLPALRPVREDMIEIAVAQAVAVVEETELVIIRSGGDPARRTQAYTDIAAAVEDNLVILRSA